jgi:hypothetical protein
MEEASRQIVDSRAHMSTLTDHSEAKFVMKNFDTD